MIDRLLADALCCPFLSTDLQSEARLHTLKLLDSAVSGDHFITGVCLSVTFLIVDL